MSPPFLETTGIGMLKGQGLLRCTRDSVQDFKYSQVCQQYSNISDINSNSASENQ